MSVYFAYLESASRQVGGRKGDDKTDRLVSDVGFRPLLHRRVQRDDGECVEGAGTTASAWGWCQGAHSFN